SHTTTTGGELDIDDTNGFGPEHYTVGPTIQDGKYKVRVHYFADRDADTTATQVILGAVDILLDEGLPTQKLETKIFRILIPSEAAKGPGGTGISWKDIAEIDVKNKTITLL
ncbi:MAG: DUF2135 domain-containing protein, partial [bacterium]